MTSIHPLRVNPVLHHPLSPCRSLTRPLLLIVCLWFLSGCFSQPAENNPRKNTDTVTFCEVSEYVFTQDTPDFFTVSCTDMNNDGWTDIFFNNHNKEPINFLINDAGTFSDIRDAVGIREIPWVTNLLLRPHFSPYNFGYFIWHDRQYDWRWKIRWSGGGTARLFSGKICPVIKSFDHAWLDQFTMQNPSAVGKGVEAMLDDSKCVLFKGVSTDELQGIDLFISPEIGLVFDLYVDGATDPQLVSIGAGKDTPPTTPFMLRTTDRHGCAWGDYNNDGYNDLFAVRGGIVGFLDQSTQGKLDELYQNQKNGTLKNMYSESGFKPNHIRGRGVQWVDIDGDGLLDLSVAGRGDELSVFRNIDGNNFVEATLHGVENINASFPNWSDINGDGLPDLLLAGGLNSGDAIVLNKGSWKFEDITNSTGLADTAKLYEKYHLSIKEIGAGLSDGTMISPADFDNNGSIDLFIGSPYGENGTLRLLCNQGNESFRDCTAETGLPISGPWREAQWADYDNDGNLDLLLLSPQATPGTRLFRNTGNGTFVDVTEKAGINLAQAEAAIFFDYNNDGFLDIAAVGRQSTQAETACPDERNVPIKSQGVQFKHVFKNLGNSNNWLFVELEGTKSNRNGLGARVILRSGNTQQLRSMGDHAKGRYAQHTIPLHFGLGAATQVDHITIRWPSGINQEIKNISANQRLHIQEPQQ